MEKAKISGKSPTISAVVYDRLKGVDFSTDPGLVAAERSPFAQNLMSGPGGYPEKRPGWRTVRQLDGAVYGMHAGRVDGQDAYLVHAGTKLYRWDPYLPEQEPEVLYSDMPEQYSQYFGHQNQIYILSGKEYLVYGKFDDVLQVKLVKDIAKVPTVVINSDPEGGGVPLEDVNMLTNRRKAGYVGRRATYIYVLPERNVGNTWFKLRILNENTGEWDEFEITENIESLQPTRYQDIKDAYDEEEDPKEGLGKYIAKNYVKYAGLYWDNRISVLRPLSVNREYGVLRLSRDYEKKIVESSGGADNFEIVYEAEPKENAYDSGIIGKCTICTLYENRVFVSGNPDKPAYDWHSAAEDPTYYPDTGYAQVGNDGSAIMGYCKVGNTLAVVKEDSQQDASIYLRTAATLNGSTVFSLRQGVSGLGAVSKRSFANLLDDPMYLTRSGVYAITSNLVTEERTLANRSRFVDPRLTRELHPEEAVSCIWNGMLLLSMTDGTVYLLDGKQTKVYLENSLTGAGYNYEAYYWTDLPAKVWMPDEKNLFFGTEDGRLCRLNTDIEGVQKYNDDGRAIKAVRATRMEFCGDFLRYKTMVKKGSGLMMQPYSRSSVQVYVRTDRAQTEPFFQIGLDDFDWYGDEEGDNFFIWKGAQLIPFGKKVKKWKWIQLILENDVVNEGFGVYGVIIRHQKLNLV